MHAALVSAIIMKSAPQCRRFQKSIVNDIVKIGGFGI
jgi:hypothetical protein